MNSKTHAVCDGEGRPVILLLPEGQMSDHKDASLALPALPPAKILIADRGYDSRSFREALLVKGIEPCISSLRAWEILLGPTRDEIPSSRCTSATCLTVSIIATKMLR